MMAQATVCQLESAFIYEEEAEGEGEREKAHEHSEKGRRHTHKIVVMFASSQLMNNGKVTSHVKYKRKKCCRKQ